MNAFRGRGAAENPANRFERFTFEPDPDLHEESQLKTQYFKDPARSIITTNDSPDIGFTASLNPYRGCEHGCIYCYARPTHEYLGFSSGLDFESKIMVKENAPELLFQELASPKWQPQVLVMSGVTDAYQPIEKKLQITRRCLEVLAQFKNPCVIITKNNLVTRDIDILTEMAAFQGASVMISITTLDAKLCQILEPRTSQPSLKLQTIEKLAAAKIPVGVMVAPIIPALTEHEVPKILAAAYAAGARCAGYTVLRLPYALKDLFAAWLETHFPDRKEKVLHHIRDLRGGKLNDANFGSRMKGEGVYADQIKQLFNISSRRAGFAGRFPELSVAAFYNAGKRQLSLSGF